MGATNLGSLPCSGRVASIAAMNLISLRGPGQQVRERAASPGLRGEEKEAA